MNCTDGVCSFPITQETNDTNTFLIQPSESIEWLLYGASWCSYCRKAKDLLYQFVGQENVYYFDIKCMDKNLFISQMSSLTNNQQTIPMIFHKTTFIGGYTNLVEFLSK